MVKTIKLYDPRDKQYGDLSNNYKSWMTIDKVRYRTVTNFILSNMLTTPHLRSELQEFSDIKNIENKYTELLTKETNSTRQNAIEEAYTSKIKNNQVLTEKLLSTGKSPINYIDNDELLGSGKQGTGYNLVGKIMMQIRHQLRNAFKYQEETKAQQDKDYTIYEAYLAQKSLQQLMFKGQDITEYIGKSPSDIIDYIGRSEVMKGSLDHDTVINILVKKNLIDQEVYLSVDYPTILAQVIRKNELGMLRKRQIAARTKIIFEMYIDYMIEKNFPSLKPEEYVIARNQQLEKIGYEAYDDIAQRVIKLYYNDMLSERLSKNIDYQVHQLYIPTTRDIDEAEAYILPTNEKSTDSSIPYTEPIGIPIEIYPVPQNEEQAMYTVFSPIDDTLMININRRIFPTISHYVIASLLAHIPSIKNMTNAYKYLIIPSENTVPKFVNLDVSKKQYDKLIIEDMTTRIEYYMQMGMNSKFENRTYQDSLLLTGDSKLEWNDSFNSILGNPGNLAGKYLMTLRKKFKLQRDEETIDSLKVEDIRTIMEKDKFLNDWLQMRVSDMCKVIHTMKNNLNEKLDSPVNITAKLVSSTLDKVYQPCSHIYESAKEITAPVPIYFRLMVQTCPGFSNAETEVVEVLWRRVAVIMYYLIEHTKNLSTYNIRSILGNIEQLVTQGGSCIEIASNPRDNCIISALINILVGIVQFKKDMGTSSILGKQDVETATSIILNNDIIGEVMPSKLNDEDIVFEDAVLEAKRVGADMATKAYNNYDIDMDEMSRNRTDALRARSKYWAKRLTDKKNNEELESVAEESLNEEEEEEDEDDDFDEMERQLELSMEKTSDDDIEPGTENASLLDILKNMEGVKYPGKFATLIAGATNIIKGYKMSNRVKTNRINFFATQR
jgi:predicted NAD-dependent protein-ADP-ribosyltransferase YbiA (DUF1768 family)